MTGWGVGRGWAPSALGGLSCIGGCKCMSKIEKKVKRHPIYESIFTKFYRIRYMLWKNEQKISIINEYRAIWSINWNFVDFRTDLMRVFFFFFFPPKFFFFFLIFFMSRMLSWNVVSFLLTIYRMKIQYFPKNSPQ